MTCPERLLLTGQTESYYFCLKIQFLPKLKPEKNKIPEKKKSYNVGSLQLQPGNKVQCGLEKSLGGKKYYMSDSRPKGTGR